MYEDVDVDMPKINIPKEEQDPHSKRLLKVCDLWDKEFTDAQVKNAKRAYYGAVSYVDDCLGRLLGILKDCDLEDDTIVIFSGDHGDMLGERGLWYKMSYFESSVRVPFVIHVPPSATANNADGQVVPHRVSQNVSTLDILPTMCGLVGATPHPDLPMDGHSLLPHLEGRSDEGHDTVIAEYTGEGTIAPLMMIRRGAWKFIVCPTDGVQLFNLQSDPDEVVDLAKAIAKKAELGAPLTDDETVAAAQLSAFETEAAERWDFDSITKAVRTSQRQRLLVWPALKVGKFTSWDHDPQDDGREKYIRSHMDLDDLERRARFPPVDRWGKDARPSAQ